MKSNPMMDSDKVKLLNLFASQIKGFSHRALEFVAGSECSVVV